MTQTLPNATALCDGRYEPIDKRHEMLVKECRNCLRLTAPRPENVWLMLPEIVDGQCKNRLISDHKGS